VCKQQLNRWFSATYLITHPLCITSGYYPNFPDNLLGTQFFDIDVDHLCSPKKFKKNPTHQLLKKPITGHNGRVEGTRLVLGIQVVYYLVWMVLTFSVEPSVLVLRTILKNLSGS
jgi:hypothetical protein